ncbi:MAG: hypothetical protein ACXAEN_21410 [Candidatus Thorarchaeota archaeon]
MATPVRYPSGVTNVKPGDACANLPAPSMTRLHYYFDDFDYLLKVGQGGLWTTVTDGADGSIALADADGGQILLTHSTVSENDCLMYNANENFTIESGKRMWFGIRCQMNTEFTEVGLQAGLSVATATAVSATGANWIGFFSTSDDANVDFVITAAGTRVGSALSIGGALDGSMHTYEFEFDGVSAFKYFVDGVHAGTVSTTSFPTTEMGPVIGIMAWSANPGSTLNVDWIYAAKERETTND